MCLKDFKMDDSFILSNFHTICRLCMKKSTLMVSIFVPDEDTSVPLTSKIGDCFQLQMDPSDGLPGRICYKCLFQLEQCSQFRQQCIQSQMRLRQITSSANELDISNSAELGNYNHHPQTKSKSDEFSIVEERVVTVVDPSMDYDSSEDTDSPEQTEPKVTNGDTNPVKELIDDFLKNVSMCQFCDQAFVTMEKCKQHEDNFHDPNLPFNCVQCSLVFAERPQYIQHTRMVHSTTKPHMCTECEKCFTRRSDLRKHSIVHTGIRPFQCHHCFKTFARNTNLSKHIRIHSSNKPHVCPLCPRSFVDKNELQQHVRVHAGQKPYACRHCPATFNRRDKLVKHEIKHVQSGTQQGSDDGDMVVNVNPFSNLLSPNQLSEQSNSNFDLPSVPDHIIGENSFGDQIHGHPKTPSKLVKNPAKLKATMKNRPKNIKCHQCPKRFSSLDAYKTHVSIAHIGSRVFQCKVCFKKFNRKRELDRHSVTHSNSTMLSCSQCDQIFITKDKLIKHEQTHSECLVENLPCIECGATFEEKDELVAHLKSHFVNDFNEDGAVNEIKKEPEIDLSINETFDTQAT